MSLFSGTVITNYGSSILIETESGNRINCASKKKQGHIVTGDKIRWKQISPNQGEITAVLPRQSLLSRHCARGEEKPVCANIDQVIIVQSLAQQQTKSNNNFPLETLLLDCYLVAAEISDISPVIVLNKSDLIDDATIETINNKVDLYRGINYPLYITSAITKHGIPDLVKQLKNSTVVLVGESGVGKSSIIKLLLPQEDIRIGSVSDKNKKGKHTTTTSALYHLADGGYIIDSPGAREFRLSNFEADKVAYGFKEFRDYIGQCKFRNCSHLTDKGCAVNEAVKNNRISESRYSSYRKIITSHVT